MARKLILGAFLLLVLFATYSTYYYYRHRMLPADERTVNAEARTYRLLLATQSSTYKDSLVKTLLDELADKDIAVRIVDAHHLGRVDPADYDAYVLIHTWEYFSYPLSVAEFIKRADTDRTYVVCTSGGGNQLPDGVDGITSASVPAHIDRDAANVLRWLALRFPAAFESMAAN